MYILVRGPALLRLTSPQSVETFFFLLEINRDEGKRAPREGLQARAGGHCRRTPRRALTAPRPRGFGLLRRPWERDVPPSFAVDARGQVTV